MRLRKIFKWIPGLVRVALAKLRLGSKLSLSRGGKPAFLGRGVRLSVVDGGILELGSGVYIDDFSRFQVCENARLSIGSDCYFNTNCRVVACEEISIGEHTMIGPNVCMFDHDHLFSVDGVHRKVTSSSTTIGERCWIGANTLVTKGASIGDRICVGGGSVVSRPLSIPGVYVGAPAHLVRELGDMDC